MQRSGFLAIAMLATITATVEAQSYSGTWSTTTQTGTALTLQLQQDARGQVFGSLTGNATVFQVQAQLQQGQVVGYARNPSSTAPRPGASRARRSPRTRTGSTTATRRGATAVAGASRTVC